MAFVTLFFVILCNKNILNILNIVKLVIVLYLWGMEQVYFHYKEWEDYQNGMYRKVKKEDESYFIEDAIKILTNQDLFYSLMEKMCLSWTNSTLQNMTNQSSNRRSWLGQATCCFSDSVPEYLTRKGWGKMKESDRIAANQTASLFITKWQHDYMLSTTNQIELF